MKGEDFRDNYEFDIKEDKLGEGSYGIVYRATNIHTKEKRAIKIIDIKKYISDFQTEKLKPPTENEIQNYIDLILKEIKIMQVMEGENHENINTVKFYEYYYMKNVELAIVMELCDENLALMIANNRQNFNFEVIKDILNQLNNSFRIMHKNKIAHRDLKPQNILVKYEKTNKNKKNKYIIKLSDYGEAKRLTMTKNVFKTKVGTFQFMSPEVMDDETFGLKCDLWSLGVIIYLIYFKQFPYSAKTEYQLHNQIKNYGQRYFIKSKNEDFDDLISKLLVKDHENRLSWEQYFDHPFVKENEILITLNISEKEINKNIYFLNGTDNQNTTKNEEIINLKKEDCDLFINDDLYEFNSSFKPEKKGEYKIKLLFKKRLKNCSYMFNNCDNIIKLDLSLFNSSEIMNMHYMFGKCHFLKEVNLASFKTDKVINMSYLFNKCSNLETIVFSESFDTSNVEDMSFMFHNCYFLKKISFPNSFITKKVKSMECMFRNCYNLKQLDLKNFETNEVINLSYMFDGCCELTEILIDSDKFKTDKVKEMGKMFNGCTNLENVNIKEFNYPNIKRMDQMFKSCEKLNEINLSKLKLNDQINIYNIFEDLKDVKVIVNKESVDKFKKQNKDINYITN